jgi:hypothetical protein
VAIIDGNNPPIYCTQECGTCPEKMYCDAQTFGLIGLSFCRFSLEPDGVAPATPPAPTEPPRLPCKEDGDCEGELVCATFQGKNDCTKICAVEDDCSPPSLGGVTLDLLTCGTDEGQARQVCLPDMACFPDIMSCIGGMPGGDEGGDMGGALGGMPGG